MHTTEIAARSATDGTKLPGPYPETKVEDLHWGLGFRVLNAASHQSPHNLWPQSHRVEGLGLTFWVYVLSRVPDVPTRRIP